MSGGSQIFFGAATPACWTVILVEYLQLDIPHKQGTKAQVQIFLQSM